MAKAPGFSKITSFLTERLGYSKKSAAEAVSALREAGMQDAKIENQFVSHLKEKYSAGARGVSHNDEGLMETLSSVKGIGGSTYRAGGANKGLKLSQVAERNRQKVASRATEEQKSHSIQQRLADFKEKKAAERAAEGEKLSREYYNSPEVKGYTRDDALDEENNIRATILQQRAEREQAVADSKYIREKFGTGIGRMEKNATLSDMVAIRYGGEKGGGNRLAEATKKADEKWAKEHPDLDNQGEQLPLGQRVKNWFKSGPVAEANEVNVEQQKLKERLLAKHKGKTYSDGTVVGGGERRTSTTVPSNAGGSAGTSGELSFDNYSRDALEAIVREQGKKYWGRGAQEKYHFDKMDRRYADINRMKNGKEKTAAIEQFNQDLQSGPGFNDYMSGNQVWGKAAGVGVAALTASAVMGDGRRSNAQLYSSPF